MDRLVLVIVTIFLAALVLGCGKKEEPPAVKKPVTPQEVKQEAKEALDTLKAYGEQQKEEYQKKVDGHVADMQKKMDDLKGQIDKAAPELKAKLEKEMEAAKGQAEALKQNLEDMKAATGKTWEDLKGGVNQALQDWKKSQDK
ncbi:MAG: hypothetical protein WAU47_04385 [Desulfobaccales bacterium]